MNQLAANPAAAKAAAIFAEPRRCRECGVPRAVREIMAGRYAVLGACGHVQPLAEAELAELGGGQWLPVYHRPGR